MNGAILLLGQFLDIPDRMLNFYSIILFTRLKMSNTLSFQNINLDVQSKSGVKRIVHNVHGSAKSGEM